MTYYPHITHKETNFNWQKSEQLAPSPAPTNTTCYSIPDLEALSVQGPIL